MGVGSACRLLFFFLAQKFLDYFICLYSIDIIAVPVYDVQEAFVSNQSD